MRETSTVVETTKLHSRQPKRKKKFRKLRVCGNIDGKDLLLYLKDGSTNQERLKFVVELSLRLVVTVEGRKNYISLCWSFKFSKKA